MANPPPLPPIAKVLEERFAKSYLARAEYPKNLMPRTIGMYKSALETWRAQLDAMAPNLFYEDDDEVEVCFRDLVVDSVGGSSNPEGVTRCNFGRWANTSHAALDKRNIHNAGKLTAYLGITEVQDSADPSKVLIAADKKDPKSRFM